MKTDDLIDALARELEPAKPARAGQKLAMALTAGAGLGLLLLLASLGLREDFGTHVPVVLAKAGFSAALVAITVPLLLRLAKPGRPVGWRLGAAMGALALAVLIGCVSLLGEAPDDRSHALTGGGFPWCLVIIPALATPAAALLTWFARAMAPTRLELTGAAIGAVSGGVGAAVYAMYCPVDTAPFVAVWYALAIALCAAFGAIVAARFLRW